MSYSTLYTYSMLAQGTLTTSGSAITTNASYYGSTVVGTNLTGTLDTSNAATAISQLTALTNSLNNTVSGLSGSATGSGTSTSVTFTPGYYTGTGTYVTSTIILDGGGNANAIFIFKGPAFTFTGCTFSLTNSASASNIFWVADNAFTATNSNVFGTVICEAFTSTNDAAPNIVMTGHFYSRTALTLTRSGAGTFTITSSGEIPAAVPTDYSPPIIVDPTPPAPPVCYAKGTLILTQRGYVPIEKLKAGHKIVTQGKIVDHVLQPKANVERVIWVSHFTSDEGAICISKDAFGENYPFQDLYVSPDHCMLIHGKMVRAKYLVNDDTIYKEAGETVYYHVECEKHSAIVANGVLSETYADLDNRHMFEESDRFQPRNIQFHGTPRC